MRLQWQSQKGNRLALILTILLMFLALSSFLADTSQVLMESEQMFGPLSLGEWSAISFSALGVGVATWLFWDWLKSRRG